MPYQPRSGREQFGIRGLDVDPPALWSPSDLDPAAQRQRKRLCTGANAEDCASRVMRPAEPVDLGPGRLRSRRAVAAAP
jgi:hypothetical protein